jgi:hypothetical protein
MSHNEKVIQLVRQTKKDTKRIYIIIYYYLLYYVGIMSIERRFAESPNRKIIQYFSMV